MRIFGWLFFFLFLILLAFDYYFYRMHWLPSKNALEDLQKEELEVFKQLGGELKITATPPEVELPQTLTESLREEDKTKWVFKEEELFIPGRTELNDTGEKLLQELLEKLKDFKEMEILIAPDPQGRKITRDRVLNIKYFLVKKGLNKNKVWAWIRKNIPPGEIKIEIKL